MARKIKKYKVGIDSETYAVSIVDAPAIESDFITLKGQEMEKVLLEKEEKHMLYGAALIPNKDIYRNNGEQEFYINFTEESIEKMAQDFMKEYRQNEVTLDHKEMANDITIVESWLVDDPYKDKANALGINVPKGTWMIGMKVNQIDVWERVKNGELKGFSVESMISLEEFGKQNDNNMIDTNESMFWDKMKNILNEVFTSLSMTKKEGEIEPINEIDLAQQSSFTSVEDYNNEVNAIKEELEEETPTVEPQVEVKPSVTEEPKVEETVVEEPIVDVQKDNHLEELVNSLKEEIAALKEMNNGLQDRIKDLGKQPSTSRVNTNAKPSNGDAYSAWREQMRNMIG